MGFPLHAPGSNIEPTPSFPSIEKSVLEYWKKSNIFERSVQQREGSDEWVFYDGPPFANGLPHYGHLLTGYAKDVFPRFHTMRGKQVHRRFGWDTHGLPAELEAERQLGITDKTQIEEMGIEAFNQAAKESVLRYTKEWQDYVTRQARWVDFDNDYKTLDLGFMESVIWAFKQLYEKGLAYEGYRVLPYCWRDQTPLSNHELRMDDDVYQQRQDRSVTVTFPLTGPRADALEISGVRALAWTTTPWTLPTNAALAVGPEINYVIVAAGPQSEESDISYLLAADTVKNYFKELGYDDQDEALRAISRTIVGEDLRGVEYEPVFSYYSDRDRWGLENAWKILVAEYVETGEGTGIVHQAPAYGEEDQVTCLEANIPVVISTDEAGRFLSQVTDVAGQQVFEANSTLIKLLRKKNRLFAERSFEHSYPHCWRCRTPLIYRAVSSWFVRVTEVRERMLELNEVIDWVPSNVKHGQFGKWLSNARDWSISRNRYWGSPIPVWKSDNPEFPRIDVYGSIQEIERDFGVGLTDLHRPFIDSLVRPNPDDPSGESTMRRIPDVLDVWFDSGSMPFAQVHYPFENRDWFDSHNPADFIVEYIGQTRGWFYTMHVLAAALFDRPAFSRVISHGIVLGSDGQKMSKSLRNYPDVFEVFERDGADAMRWFLMSSSVIRGGNLVVTEEGIREGVRQFLLPFWSTYYFLSLYVGAYEPQWSTNSTNLLDRYILAKTRELIESTTKHFESLDSPLAAAAIRDFADAMTNWFVRRSRDRFWDGNDTGALDTLFTVLETLARLSAPLTPLISEEIWRGLTGKDSVHLSNWPLPEEFPENRALVESMDFVREVASAVLALRKSNGLRVRLPLAKVTIVAENIDALNGFEEILAEELNVRRVVLCKLTEAIANEYGIRQQLLPIARALGPRVGAEVQSILRSAKLGDWTIKDGEVSVAGFILQEGEYELEYAAEAEETAVSFLRKGGFVLLDTEVTKEFAAEGLARDAIRWVQQERKNLGLNVSDRISLSIEADHEAISALLAHEKMIAKETLSVSIQIGELSERTGELSVGENSKICIEVLRSE